MSDKLCMNCRYWKISDHEYSNIVFPYHPGTFDQVMSEHEEVQVFGYRVRYCTHSKVLFYQRPEIDGACVVDGSEYNAALITSERFGCVLFESGVGSEPLET